MDLQEASSKARNVMLREGLDKLLIKLYLELKNYPAWKENSSIDTRWNFGLTGFETCLETMRIAHEQKDILMLIGKFNGRHFKIGGNFWCGTFPDGEDFSNETIRFGFGEDCKVAVEAIFGQAPDACMPTDYKLLVVNEFHYSEEWVAFLLEASQAIDDHKVKMDQLRAQEMNEASEGKFSF